MLNLVVVCVLAFGGGAILGKNLALKGITSDNALKNYQQPLLWLLLTVVPLLGGLIAIDKFNLAPVLPKIFPPRLLIYLAGYFNETIIGLGCFFLGLLFLLELSGKRSHLKILQLLLAMGAIAFALSVLLFMVRPVQNLVAQPKIINGIVMQTTPYTCAPSSIATLARYIKTQPNLTEKTAIALTKTNRFGTTTLAEIRALKKLGLNPQYRHNLTIDDLISLGQPALMHVKEKNKSGKGLRFSHAVAYLAADPTKKVVLIGNPLYGLQIKTFEELDHYWFGEAITVNPSSI
ncbi:MAG: cysteine peptidase family C39 domain-containing protein [Waterburya sp.]